MANASEKEKTVPVTVTILDSEYQALKTISATTHKPMAEVLRGYIRQGMDIESTQSNIDFIRKNVREEVEVIMNKHTGRTLSLLYKIGMYVIPQSLFTAEIVHKIFRLKDDDKADFAEMWERSKNDTATVLQSRDVTIDQLYNEHYGNYK